MPIDPKILARMQPEDDGSEGAVYADEPQLSGMPAVEKPLPADKHVGCAALTGTWKQKKWAVDLRNVTLALSWHRVTLVMLKAITDSTWWIANKAIVNTMKFKMPTLAQLDSNVDARAKALIQAEPVTEPMDADVVERQNRLARDVEARVSDAERWAASVSQNPKRAEAAILAVLSRLYEGTMKTRLRNASCAALEASGEADAKDMDAINRMLTS